MFFLRSLTLEGCIGESVETMQLTVSFSWIPLQGG
eukprot:COSAG06_NODE_47079_length_342_cov_0.584362_1_plen_34_part_10